MTSWNDVASTIRFGRLASADGWSYSFEDADVPTTVRFIIGEKESHADTDEVWVLLWTMANRMKLLWPRYPTFRSMCHSYSMALHGDPQEVPRRARIQNLMPDDVPDAALKRASAFLEGRVSVGLAAGFVEFDQCEPGYVHPRLGRPAFRSESGECYWRNDATASWDEQTIIAVPLGGGRGSIVPVLVGMTALGIAVWQGTRLT